MLTEKFVFCFDQYGSRPIENDQQISDALQKWYVTNVRAGVQLTLKFKPAKFQ